MLNNFEADVFSCNLFMSAILCLVLDEAIIPAELIEIFERVRNNADIMPAWQMEVS